MANNVSSNNLTSLYGGGKTTVLPTTPVPVVDSSIASKNLTTLYSGAGAPVIPTSPYGNANVERFLNAGTDGGNTVTNINMAGDLNVGGISNLGNVGNVTITGGNLNYVLQTDGTGNLSWVQQIGANTVNGSEYIHFDVVTTGNNQTFSNANIALYSSNVNMNVMKNGINIEPSLFEKTGNTTIQVNILLNAGDTIDILAAAGGGGGGSGTPGGNVTQVQYNGGGVFSANASFTFDQPNSLMTVGNINSGNVTLTGGSNTESVIRQFAPNNIVIPSNFTNNTVYDLATVYWPNASTGMPTTGVIRSRGNITTPTTAIAGDRIAQTRHLVYNGNTNVLAVSEVTNASGTVNSNANATYTGGSWTISTGNPLGDIGNSNASSGLNQLQFNNGGGLSIIPGTAPAGSTPAISITTYGENANSLGSTTGIVQQRARGNRDAITSVLPNDQIGQFTFIPYNGTSYTGAKSASIRAEVESTYTAGNAIVPITLTFRTIDSANTSQFTTINGNGRFVTGNGIISNGIVEFSGASSINLGSNSIVHITGGSAGQALVTNGSGNLSWGNVANSANSNYANFAGTAFSVAGANVTGFVANASYANYANIAFSVSGSNVNGAVGLATYATTANSVAVGNVSGIGNVAVVNLNSNANTVLSGLGTWVPQIGGSGNGVPAGALYEVQTNAGNGFFGSMSGFEIYAPTSLVKVPNISATGTIVSNSYTSSPITYTANLVVYTAGNANVLMTAVGSNVGITGNLTVVGNINHQVGTANLNTLVVANGATFTGNVVYNSPIVGLPSLSIDAADDGGVYTRTLDVLTRQISYDTTPLATNHPLQVTTANMQVGSSANLQYIFLNGAANTYYMTPITYPGVTANVHWASGSAPSTGVANKWNVYSFNVLCTAANTVEIFASTSTY